MSIKNELSFDQTQTMVCDIVDVFPDQVRILNPLLRHFGGICRFHGPVRTIQSFEDNVLIKQTLETPGQGAVLVVDGGESLRCALIGGNLADLAHKNGWAGIVIAGAVRDVPELRAAQLGIMAISAFPKSSGKQGVGEVGAVLKIAGQIIHDGDYLYADEDGIALSTKPLHLK